MVEPKSKDGSNENIVSDVFFFNRLLLSKTDTGKVGRELFIGSFVAF